MKKIKNKGLGSANNIIMFVITLILFRFIYPFIMGKVDKIDLKYAQFTTKQYDGFSINVPDWDMVSSKNGVVVSFRKIKDYSSIVLDLSSNNHGKLMDEELVKRIINKQSNLKLVNYFKGKINNYDYIRVDCKIKSMGEVFDEILYNILIKENKKIISLDFKFYKISGKEVEKFAKKIIDSIRLRKGKVGKIKEKFPEFNPPDGIKFLRNTSDSKVYANKDMSNIYILINSEHLPNDKFNKSDSDIFFDSFIETFVHQSKLSIVNKEFVKWRKIKDKHGNYRFLREVKVKFENPKIKVKGERTFVLMVFGDKDGMNYSVIAIYSSKTSTEEIFKVLLSIGDKNSNSQ